MQKKSDIIYLLMEKHITTYKILLKTEREPDGLQIHLPTDYMDNITIITSEYNQYMQTMDNSVRPTTSFLQK